MGLYEHVYQHPGKLIGLIISDALAAPLYGRRANEQFRSAQEESCLEQGEKSEAHQRIGTGRTEKKH